MKYRQWAGQLWAWWGAASDRVCQTRCLPAGRNRSWGDFLGFAAIKEFLLGCKWDGAVKGFVVGDMLLDLLLLNFMFCQVAADFRWESKFLLRYRVQVFKVKVKAFPPGKSFPWSSWSGWPRWDRLRGCRGAQEAQWWWEISSCCISSHPHFPPRSPQTCLFDELVEETPPSYLFLLITKDVTWKCFTGSWWWKLRESGHLIVKPHKTTLGAVHYLAGSHNTMTQRVKTCFRTNNRGHFFICMIYAWFVK